jgi:23S rRNA (cytosine1962-C5)-methyltransferase
MRFWVNLDDYIDTGLFADHRETRCLLREQIEGKSLLNLFCYTGAFTVAAALGGAASTASVDLSAAYLRWAEDNLELNGRAEARHSFVESDCESFLKAAAARDQRWDFIVVDPPSFSTIGSFGDPQDEFDVVRAHPKLLFLTLACLAPGGTILFSTNHQRFEPSFGDLGAHVEELTHHTVPEDFRQRGPFQPSPVHRTFRLTQHSLAPEEKS